MAEQQTEFSYHNIELYKSESLGSGSYGGVCKAKCDGLLCAAKIMHPTLFDLRDPGTVSYLQKFQEECRLLSLARHPNVVQYLATYSDPETRLPVLLMELCNECLTKFLERSPGPLPYHTQLNISHDIALALVYLHSNGLIHRDLTGNNVLMIAGPRAKITDFGMSKLSSVNPRMTALTLCPGNSLYMSPEALDEPPTYTDKLDVFSFGVLQIQILTRQFPNPTERFQLIDDPRYPDRIRMPVPETQRRHAHLQLISDTHPLKPLALQCLKNKDRERPSAQQLNERLSELKLAPQYTESLEREEEKGTVLRRRVDELHLQTQQAVAQKKQLVQELRAQRILTEAKMGQIGHLQADNDHLFGTLTESRRQLQSKQRNIVRKETELQEKQQIVEANTSELEQTREQLQISEQLVSEFQQSLGQKDRTISDLQQSNEKKIQQLVSEFQQTLQQKDSTISDLQQAITVHKRKIQQLEQKERADGDRPQQLPVAADTPQAATASAALTDLTRMRWTERKMAPVRMSRGTAVVEGNTAYFNPNNSHTVYSYQIIPGEEHWSTLPSNPYDTFTLAVVDGLLTSVGGYTGKRGVGQTNALLSLTGGGGGGGGGSMRQWSEVFPPMPTARSRTAAVCTGQVLVVAGGTYDGGYLDVVEVMNVITKSWTTATRLPQNLYSLTGVTCGDRLYLAGGYAGMHKASKLVLTCSISDLVRPQSLGASLLRSLSLADETGVWREVCSVPVAGSTLATLGGHLLAIGGKNNFGHTTADVHRYDHGNDSWSIVNQMRNERSACLAAVLPEDRLVVVGGWGRQYVQTQSVETLVENIYE